MMIAGGPRARATSTVGTIADISNPKGMKKIEKYSSVNKVMKSLILEVDLKHSYISHFLLCNVYVPRDMAVNATMATIPMNWPKTCGFSPTM